MTGFFVYLAAFALAIQVFIGLSFFISSIWEKEKRATLFGFLQFIGMAALLIVFLILAGIDFFYSGIGKAVLIAGYIIVVLAAVILIRKTSPNQRALKGTKGYIVSKVEKTDEREIVFARVRSLQPGSEQYETFYNKFPQFKEVDDERRAMGGLMGRLGAIDRPDAGPNMAATAATAFIPAVLSAPEIVKPQPQFMFMGEGNTLSPEEATKRVKGFARNIGADLIGIAEINPFWSYSFRGEVWMGNWEDWGKEINLGHKYAIVVAEEMDPGMIATAPHTPTVMESSKNYSKGAYIATQIAAFIANLGQAATANHLRHYEAVLPPLAVDAGLGEIGRLGYLMTKEFGPRIRLSAVTTDLPLIPDKPVDIGIMDFCKICKKCATCCPSNSIPVDDDIKEHNGTLRWKLNDDTCYGYWYKVGTDCCICMKVCPWSHARTFPHRLIVAMISRNYLARRLFSVMDDIFYGKKPRPNAPPKWAEYRK